MDKQVHQRTHESRVESLGALMSPKYSTLLSAMPCRISQSNPRRRHVVGKPHQMKKDQCTSEKVSETTFAAKANP